MQKSTLQNTALRFAVACGMLASWAASVFGQQTFNLDETAFEGNHIFILGGMTYNTTSPYSNFPRAETYYNEDTGDRMYRSNPSMPPNLGNATFDVSDPFFDMGPPSTSSRLYWHPIQQSNTNDDWGGVETQSLRFAVAGPDLPGQTITLMMDFGSTSAGYASDLDFWMRGISGRLNPNGFWSYDRFTISALDENGVSLNVNNYLGPSTAAFSVTAAGNDATVQGLMYNSGPAFDHTSSLTNLRWDSGSTKIGKITVDYDPIINGTAGGASAGFAIQDMQFTVIPEPSIPALSAFGTFIILGRSRKRQCRF